MNVVGLKLSFVVYEEANPHVKEVLLRLRNLNKQHRQFLSVPFR